MSDRREDWVGEKLVGGVDGIARKEGLEDEQFQNAPGEGKCTKRRLTACRLGKRAAARTRFNSGEKRRGSCGPELEPKTWYLSGACVARRLRQHRGMSFSMN